MRLLALLALALPLHALTVDEVVQLTEAGVADEIILNQMKADGSAFELAARDIVELQKKKVSPVVINWMVQQRGKPAPKQADGKPAPVPRAEQPKDEPKDTKVTIRNLGKSKVTVLVYPTERAIALVKGEISSGTVLVNGARVELPVTSGIYRVHWAAEDAWREMVIAKDITNEIEIRDDDRVLRGLGFAVLIDGKEQPDPSAPQPVVERDAEPADPGPRVYQSPYNSSVTIIRDIQQVPVRTVIVPGTSTYTRTYYPERAYANDWAGYSYYVGPSYSTYYHGRCYTPRTYHYDSCSPRAYYYGGYSYRHGHHHYSRTADNVQYYLNWPFGHRHR